MSRGLTDSELLKVYDGLPDLLAMATEVAEQESRVGGYEIQNELREEHREREEPFRWSMLYRSIYSCTKCDYANTVVKHELENPQVKDKSSPLHLVGLTGEEVHGIREHGGSFSEECRAFLEHVALQQEEG
jgi:hypothetical protein